MGQPWMAALVSCRILRRPHKTDWPLPRSGPLICRQATFPPTRTFSCVGVVRPWLTRPAIMLAPERRALSGMTLGPPIGVLTPQAALQYLVTQNYQVTQN
jgi:hypothetical protein